MRINIPKPHIACTNNPLIYEDPTGHSPIASAGIKAGLAVASAAKKLNKNVLASNKSLKPPSKNNVSAAKSATNAVMAATKSGVGYASGKVNKKPLAAMPNIAGSAIIAVADDLKKIAAKVPDYAENLVQQYTYLSTAVDNGVNGDKSSFVYSLSNLYNLCVAKVNSILNYLDENSEEIHEKLDIVGFFTGIADLINGVLYLREEEWFYAALSALAFPEVIGSFVTLAKTPKYLGKLKTAYKSIDDVVDFVKGEVKLIPKYIDDFVSFAKSIPQRVVKFGGDVLDFGKKVITKLDNGFRLLFRKDVLDELPPTFFEPIKKVLNKTDDFGRGISNNGGLTNFRTPELLDSHFAKHRLEFGNITKEQYLNRANYLIRSNGDNVLTKIRANGDTLIYNITTNEFVVKSSDGFIRTYFKPLGGIDYFLGQ